MARVQPHAARGDGSAPEGGGPQGAPQRVSAAFPRADAAPTKRAGVTQASQVSTAKIRRNRTVHLQHMRREGEPALEHVQASLAVSTEYDFPYLTAIGTVLQGWELTNMAQATEGVAQMRQGLATLRARGAEILRPSLLALLADACARHGQIEAGIGALEEAIETAEQHTERFYAAELQRLKGNLVLRQCLETGARPAPRVAHTRHAAAVAPSPSPLQLEAEACFQSALHIAQHQHARLLELRAAVSLARLWQQQGKRAATRALLAPIHDWFTEGFDTPDLQESRALLEALA